MELIALASCAVVGILLMVGLAVVRWPDEGVGAPTGASGDVRLAVVHRTATGIVVDGVLDAASVLGGRGSPIAVMLADLPTSERAFDRLSQWAADDAVVELQLPAAGCSDQTVVDVRRGWRQLRLPIALSSSR